MLQSQYSSTQTYHALYNSPTDVVPCAVHINRWHVELASGRAVFAALALAFLRPYTSLTGPSLMLFSDAFRSVRVPVCKKLFEPGKCFKALCSGWKGLQVQQLWQYLAVMLVTSLLCITPARRVEAHTHQQKVYARPKTHTARPCLMVSSYHILITIPVWFINASCNARANYTYFQAVVQTVACHTCACAMTHFLECGDWQ